MVASKSSTSAGKKSQGFVDPSSLATEITWVLNKSQTIYFCAVRCKQAFDANPEKYLSK